jgi:hypothetical protein
MCYNASTITVPVRICNSGSSPELLNVSFNGVSAAQAGGNPAVNGPTIFTGYPTSVYLPANTCTNFTVTITRPSGLTSGKVAYYQMVITDPNGQRFASVGELTPGSIIYNLAACAVVINPNAGPAPLPAPTNFVFTLNNPTGTPIVVNSEVIVLDGNLVPETNVVSLNGQIPGNPVLNQITVFPDKPEEIAVNVSYVDAQPWTPFTLQLLLDSGDGEGYVPAASASFFQTTPPTVGPLLSTSTTNGQVVVSWDVVNTGWTLVSKPTLTATNWTPVNLPVLPQPDGSQGVSLSRTNQTRFFRLLGPGSP